MSRVLLFAATVAGFAVVANQAEASLAASASKLVTDLGVVTTVGATSTGSVCVLANVNGAAGLPLGAGSSNTGAGGTAVPAATCTITIANPPGPAGFAGVYTGVGYTGVDKTPNGSAKADISKTAGGTTATAHSDWMVKTTVSTGVTFTVTSNSSANVVTGPAGPLGLAIGESKDPMFFSLDASTEINLSVILTEENLEAIADPGGDALAGVEADFALGSGDTPGTNILLSGSRSDVVGPGQSFTPRVDTLFSGAQLLPAGHYWLTDNLVTTALAVPEPRGLSVIIVGLIAVAAIRCRSKSVLSS